MHLSEDACVRARIDAAMCACVALACVVAASEVHRTIDETGDRWLRVYYGASASKASVAFLGNFY